MHPNVIKETKFQQNESRKQREPFAATWVGLEIIILGEANQTKKDKYYMISLIRGI